MTATRVGYEAAAFYRYRAIYGADVCTKIENMPSSQWGPVLQAASKVHQDQHFHEWDQWPYFDQIKRHIP